MRKWVVVILAAATAAAVGLAVFEQHAPPASALPALSKTYLAFSPGSSLAPPPLVTSRGQTFSAAQWRGHWSLVFFGFTSCPLVCPRTLSLLTAVARLPTSGIASGSTEPLFVSVDPEHDTPARLNSYLSHFDSHILGLTGSREQIDSLSHELGASYSSNGSSIDHSTSLFVVDPAGHLAGVLLHPSNPTQIAADLAALRRQVN
jgi:protein SCO1/2